MRINKGRVNYNCFICIIIDCLHDFIQYFDYNIFLKIMGYKCKHCGKQHDQKYKINRCSIRKLS